MPETTISDTAIPDTTISDTTMPALNSIIAEIEKHPFDDRLVRYMMLKGYLFAGDYVKAKEVLDVGSGSGYGTFLISQDAKRAVGVELLLEQVNAAKKKYSAPNLEYRQMDATSLSFDCKFDTVVSLQVIEHIANVDSYFNSVKSILKPNGRFLCSTPNRKVRLEDGAKPWNPEHVREYSLEEFTSALNAHFDVSLFGLYTTPQILKEEKRRIKKKIYHTWIQNLRHRLNLRDTRMVSLDDFSISEIRAEEPLAFITVCTPLK